MCHPKDSTNNNNPSEIFWYEVRPDDAGSFVELGLPRSIAATAAEQNCRGGNCGAICRYIDAPERNDRQGVGAGSWIRLLWSAFGASHLNAGRRNPNRTKCHVAGADRKRKAALSYVGVEGIKWCEPN